MTDHRLASHRSRVALLSAALLCLIVGIVGCSSHGPTPAAAPELNVLKSEGDGLYYPAYVRSQPAGPEDNSYAIQIESMLGNAQHVSLSAKTRDFFHDEAVSTSPVIGRSWLVPILAGGDRSILTKNDTNALRALRTKDGWFADPVVTDAGSRADVTARALSVLAALGSVTAEDVTASEGWLTSQMNESDLATRASAAVGLKSLGVKVSAAAANISAPASAEFPNLQPDARTELLADTYNYARLRSAAGLAVTLSTRDWMHVLDANVTMMPLKSLYQVVFILTSAGTSASDMDTADARLKADALPDGTFRDPSAYTGDILSTFYVLALKSSAGSSMTDAKMAQAVETHAASQPDSADALTKFTYQSALSLASGQAAGPTATARCAAATTVDETSAAAFELVTRACHLQKLTVGAPQVNRWSTQTAQGAVAAARLVNGFTEMGALRSTQPSWLPASSFAPFVMRGDDLGGLRNYAELLRAYTAVGGHLTAVQSGTVNQTFTSARGCPDLPDLYRATADGDCDLATSLSVWDLGRSNGLDLGPSAVVI